MPTFRFQGLLTIDLHLFKAVDENRYTPTVAAAISLEDMKTAVSDVVGIELSGRQRASKTAKMRYKS